MMYLSFEIEIYEYLLLVVGNVGEGIDTSFFGVDGVLVVVLVVVVVVG